MAAPTITARRARADGQQFERLDVDFGDENAPRVLVLDNANALRHAGHRNTFVNLCYHACRTTRRRRNFSYVAGNIDARSTIKQVVDHIDPVAVLLAAEEMAIGYTGDSAVFKQLGLHRTYTDRPPSVLTIPVRTWATTGFKRGDGPNLLGFALKHMVTAIEGRNAWTPRDIPLRALLVDTPEKLERLHTILRRKRLIAIDTEGDSLNRITNTLFTVQLSVWNDDKTVITSYVIPIRHREATWDAVQFERLRAVLRWHMMRTDVEHVYHTGTYDIGQFMHWLNFEIYLPDVWDVTAGEFGLDEQTKMLGKLYGIKKPYSLENLETRYALHREGSAIDKADRGNMNKFSLEELRVYGSYDTHNLLVMREYQLDQCTGPLAGYPTRRAFHRATVHQLGMEIKTIAVLQNNGLPIDTAYAMTLVMPGNQFDVEITKIYEELLTTPAGRRTNEAIMRDKGIDPGASVFSTGATHALEMTKPSHLQKLFFDGVHGLGLEPVNETDSGQPSTDKVFRAAYKDEVREVALFDQFQKLKTLKGNFAVGVVKRITNDRDFAVDAHLRPFYNFTTVLTGRLSANNINSQNIPAHDALAKTIKRMVKAPDGCVLGVADFSAHEIRMTGVITGDAMIRKVFVDANNAINGFRIARADAIEAAIAVVAREGDIHISNVRFFFKQEVDKKHPLRQNIKKVVFGVLYGKMAKALAKEIGASVEEAQHLIDVLFENWSVASEWITTTQADAARTFQVHYPNGRIRHLWGYIDDDIWVHRAMDRRAPNSEIQGFSSEVGVAAMHEVNVWKYQNLTRRGHRIGMKSFNIVHDAQYNEIEYRYMPLAAYLIEHSMSSMPMAYYRRAFDYELTIPLAFGFEFGRSWDKLTEWNLRTTGYTDTWSNPAEPKYIPGLLDIIRDMGRELGQDADPVIADAKRIYRVRHEELRTDPYTMRIGGNSNMDLIDGLNMFRKDAA